MRSCRLPYSFILRQRKKASGAEGTAKAKPGKRGSSGGLEISLLFSVWRWQRWFEATDFPWGSRKSFNIESKRRT